MHFQRVFAALQSIAIAMVVFAIIGFGAQSVFRPAPNDSLRQGDRLFANGEYYTALRFYQAATQEAAGPRTALRVGMLETLRGEVTSANRTFAQAARSGLVGEEYALLRLYQGHAALLNGQRSEAFGLWQTIGEQTVLRPYRAVIEAEALLDGGDYAAAEAMYRSALTGDLQPAWRYAAVNRLAALRATSDPKAALALLGSVTAQPPATPDPLLVLPLLPQVQPTRAQLLAALQAAPAQRAIQLGQAYLAAGLYGLAEAQFVASTAGGNEALAAAGYAAYARLRAGDSAGAIARLEAIVAEHPQDARLRSLLALAYLDRREPTRAQAQLEVLRKLAPRAAETYLAWGQWNTAQSDYTAAAAEYRRALDAASPDQRGTYMLALARFQLDATLRVCEDGLPAAEQAARLLDTGAAWTILAESRLSCHDYAGASSAASSALERAPSNAEAAFYRGQALALLGQRDAARQSLIAAADFAPASDWRVKAERALVVFGL